MAKPENSQPRNLEPLYPELRAFHPAAHGDHWELPTDLTIVRESFLDEGVKEILTRHGWDLSNPDSPESDLAYRMTLCLDEAVSDGIIYGNQELNPDPELRPQLADMSRAKTVNEPSDKKVFVDFDVQPGLVIVTVTDQGKGFEVSEKVQRELDETRLLDPTGRGGFIVGVYSDGLDIQSSPAGTVVKMTFRPRSESQ